MLSKVICFALNGLDGVPVEVETDINKGMVAYDLVGLPDAAVKESKERVRSAVKNSVLHFPISKITINLAPADIKKEGSHYDLPIAVSILKASDQLPYDTDGTVFLGELALDGALDNLNAMRLKEGGKLAEDMLARMDNIEKLVADISARAPLVAEEYRKKLTERIQEYLSGKADETRILTEAAVFADKCNIDEELTRLKAHAKAFREICSLEQVGRKLDFLVQEFNRECNTICSKSNDQKVTALALEMKNEIEKVREQIQNLE